MGDRASLGEHAWAYALDRIDIRDRACVGHHVFLLTGTHDYNKEDFPLVTRPIVIHSGAWIATRATVLPGVTIGALAVVGAGSVVSRSLPPGWVCAGNPCQPIGVRKLPAMWKL